MKKKAIITSCSIVIILLGLVLLTGGTGGESPPPNIRVIALERQEITRTINLTGVVYSAQSTEIHTTLPFPVERVEVRVGDVVAEGDLLALLDMSSLEMEVRQLQATLGAAQAAAGQNLTAARTALEAFERNLAAGNDPVTQGAQFGINHAELAVAAAEVEISAASANVHVARRDLTEYRRYLRRNDLDRYDDFDPTLSQLRQSLSAHEGALDRARQSLESANQALAMARESDASARVLAGDILTQHRDIVEAARIATNFSDMRIAIENLQNELEKAEIRSPVTGTVTAVIAEAGAMGAGLLFVIQDTDNLVVKTNIRELDVGSLSLGDDARVRADATGSAEFSGRLTRIAPTSTVMTHGEGVSGGYAEFESEIALASGTDLRIGMSARLTMIADRSEALTLPASAIHTDINGGRAVLIALPAADGGYQVEAVSVNLGIESGRMVEVFADALQEGALIIENPTGIQSGDRITPIRG
ncbi:MAG: HlyD family secretion protein [Oscillospiraceae bacterium]|nr:HlyD family secretion protein [Oscillospiraceae bacterium]